MAENTKNVEFKNPHPELPVREPILKLGRMRLRFRILRLTRQRT